MVNLLSKMPLMYEPLHRDRKPLTEEHLQIIADAFGKPLEWAKMLVKNQCYYAYIREDGLIYLSFGGCLDYHALIDPNTRSLVEPEEEKKPQKSPVKDDQPTGSIIYRKREENGLETYCAINTDWRTGPPHKSVTLKTLKIPYLATSTLIPYEYAMMNPHFSPEDFVEIAECRNGWEMIEEKEYKKVVKQVVDDFAR